MSQSPAEQAEFVQATDRRSAYRRELERLNQLVEDGQSWSGHERNCAFLNLGQEGTENRSFATVSSVTGIDFPDDGRALASVDWDRDGDLDLWTTNRTAPRLRFLQNHGSTGHHFLQLRLVGTRSNRDAVGALVRLVVADGAERPILRVVRAGDGFLSQSSKWLHFGLGQSSRIERLEVRWPNGERQTWAGDSLVVDQFYEWVEGTESPRRVTVQAVGTLSGTAESGREPSGQAGAPRSHSPNGAGSAESASSTLVGRPSLPSSADRVLLSSRLALPHLPLQSWDEQPTHVAQLAADKPVWLVLWAAWCLPCIEELTEITSAAERLRAAGVEPIAVSLDAFPQPDSPESTLQQATQQLAGMKFPFSSAVATESLLQRLQLASKVTFGRQSPIQLPTSYLISRQGSLAAVYRGRVSVDQVIRDAGTLLADEKQLLELALPFPGQWLQGRRRSAPLTFVAHLLDEHDMDEAFRFVRAHRSDLAGQAGYTAVVGSLGTSLAERNRLTDAIEAYQWALEVDPNDVPVLNNLAWHLATAEEAAVRQPEAAVRYALQAARLTRDRSPAILDTLATAYLASQQIEPARATLRQALSLAQQQGNQGMVEKLKRKQELLERTTGGKNGAGPNGAK